MSRPSCLRLHHFVALVVLLILQWVLCVTPALASEQRRFHSLGTQQGLSRALVKDLEKDSYGFLWVATENGLNRFDGYRFEVFRRDSEKMNSLPDNHVLSLANVPGIGLFAGLQSGMLVRFDMAKESFEKVEFVATIAEAFSTAEPDYMEVDGFGNIWIASTNGLFAYSTKTGESWHFHQQNSGLRTPYIKHVFFDRQGSMWLATDAGLAKVSSYSQPGSAEIVSFDADQLPSHYAKRVVQDKQGRIWLGTDGGLSVFDPSDGSFTEHYSYQADNSNSLSNNFIKAMIADKEGRIWIGHDLGLSVFNPEDRSFQNHRASFDDEYGLVNNYVKSLLQDRSGVVWIGTDHGISFFNPDKDQFRSLIHKPGSVNGLQGNMVYSIWVDHPGQIWVATNNGLHLWSRITGELRVFRHMPNDPFSIGSNIVRAVMRDNRNRLWIGTDAGLNYLDDSNNKFEFKSILAGNANGRLLNNNFVVTLKQLSDGNIYVGTWGGGVNIINPVTLEVSYLSETPDAQGRRLYNNKIANIFEDSQRKVWLRSGDILDLNTGSISSFPFKQTLNNINFFYEDQKGYIWIGTTSNGLHYYDPASGKLQRLNTNTEIKDGVVAGMAQDKNGFYWIAVNKILLRLNKDLEQPQLFDAADGLHGGEFSNEAVFTGNEGYLYFGGSPGITYFDPDKIHLNQVPVRVYLTGLGLNNEILTPMAGSLLDSSMLVKKRLVLPFQHRELVIRFVGINYTNPQKNTYSYRIEGLQSDWIMQTADQRSASYFRLPPGQYRFVVRAANSSGIWSEEVASVELLVLPAWYMLWWVRVSAVLLLLLLVYLLITQRTRKLKRQKVLLEQKVSERTFQLQQQKQEIAEKNEQLQEASRAKSEFLANMSHEIRTPLNGVIGFADLLMKTELSSTQKEYLGIVNQSAENLLNIINDILDFSKIEAGKLELFYEKADIHDIGSQSVDIISYQAQSKGLEILLNMPPDLPRFVHVDTIRIKQVLVNLLSNAVKFTERGEIELKISMLRNVSKAASVFRFSVRDTGIGIQPDKLSVIFEAFTQEDNSTTKRFGGTGLGLTISNRLLQLMGSKLEVESTPAKGSLFYFDLKLRVESEENEYPESVSSFKNALIVDDNATNRSILHKMLKHIGIESDQADSSSQAMLKLSHNNKYDLVFLDYHMPVTDGLETARMIRQAGMLEQSATKLILWHSSSDDDLAQRCSELRIDARITKPLKIKVLVHVLQKLEQPYELPQAEQPEHAIQFEGRYRILLVEDNPVNMLLAKTILRKILPDASLIEAENGLEAIKECKKQLPDMVFMDLQMPEMNGYEATTGIRAMKGGNEVIIVALTAGNVKGEREKCFAAGMNDFLTKPVVESIFVDVIRKFLKPEVKSASAAASDVKSSELFDLENMKADLGDDPVFLREFLIVLKESLESTLETMRQCIENEDIVLLTEVAHKLKGTAFSIKTNALAAVAFRLEQCTAYDLDTIQQLYEKIRIMVEDILLQVKNETDKLNS